MRSRDEWELLFAAALMAVYGIVLVLAVSTLIERIVEWFR